eukprot:PhM_4_TR2438/c0_g3_i2/m.78775/K07359/CAMKK2; calcium/calmodulin-dependent protein kinase kinase 2
MGQCVSRSAVEVISESSEQPQQHHQQQSPETNQVVVLQQQQQQYLPIPQNGSSLNSDSSGGATATTTASGGAAALDNSGSGFLFMTQEVVDAIRRGTTPGSSDIPAERVSPNPLNLSLSGGRFNGGSSWGSISGAANRSFGQMNTSRGVGATHINGYTWVESSDPSKGIAVENKSQTSVTNPKDVELTLEESKEDYSAPQEILDLVADSNIQTKKGSSPRANTTANPSAAANDAASNDASESSTQKHTADIIHNGFVYTLSWSCASSSNSGSTSTSQGTDPMSISATQLESTTGPYDPALNVSGTLRAFDDAGAELQNEFIVLGALGRGAFAKGRLAVDTQKQCTVRVKILQRIAGRRALPVLIAQRNLYDQLVRGVHHPNLVRTLAVVDDPTNGRLHVITEYCPAGSLPQWESRRMRAPGEESVSCLRDSTSSVFSTLKEPEFNAKLFRVQFLDVLHGLECLHDRHGIVHMDIRPDNIVVSRLDDFKLCDFGTREMLMQDFECRVKEHELVVRGSNLYDAPELLASQPRVKFTKASDVWALGVTMYTQVYGAVPFSGHNLDRLRRSIEHEPVFFSDVSFRGGMSVSVPADLIFVLRWCLQRDPTKRPTVKQLLGCAFFRPPQQRPSLDVAVWVWKHGDEVSGDGAWDDANHDNTNNIEGGYLGDMSVSGGLGVSGSGVGVGEGGVLGPLSNGWGI